MACGLAGHLLDPQPVSVCQVRGTRLRLSGLLDRRVPVDALQGSFSPARDSHEISCGRGNASLDVTQASACALPRSSRQTKVCHTREAQAEDKCYELLVEKRE